MREIKYSIFKHEDGGGWINLETDLSILDKNYRSIAMIDFKGENPTTRKIMDAEFIVAACNYYLNNIIKGE